MIHTRFIRTGRAIELIESTLSTFDKKGVERTSIILRAWKMATYDSSNIAMLEDVSILPIDTALPIYCMARYECVGRWLSKSSCTYSRAPRK